MEIETITSEKPADQNMPAFEAFLAETIPNQTDRDDFQEFCGAVLMRSRSEAYFSK